MMKEIITFIRGQFEVNGKGPDLLQVWESFSEPEFFKAGFAFIGGTLYTALILVSVLEIIFYYIKI